MNMDTIDWLITKCETWASGMDFKFLVQDTLLFSIGYDAGQMRLDKSSFDLLASEIRTTVYLAVASNQCPVESWFRMGRSLVPDSFALVSWSGTMFEYLMPCLWMRFYDGTLLGRCVRGAVQEHIDYAKTLNQEWHGVALPWGMSESAFNRQSAEGDYQYRAFGCPTVALKRGQDRDYVVAPYASMLAMLVVPQKAMKNLLLLEHLGALGPYGFHDAVDYSRPTAYGELAVVKNYMAHHIGMSLASLSNYLLGNIWQERFHNNPLSASAELLLHERAPRQLTIARVTASKDSSTGPRINRGHKSNEGDNQPVSGSLALQSVHTPNPRGALLGSKVFTVYVTAAGSGYAMCDNRYLYRWRNDGTQDMSGQFLYIRTTEKDKKRCFSATYQPTAVRGDSYRAAFAVDSATFERVDGHLQTTTKIVVSTANRAEVRHIQLNNNSQKDSITVELTSYGEVVLQSPSGDRAHPAFGNLFVDTEWLPAEKGLIARRRSRAVDDPHIYMVHVLGISPSAAERCQAAIEYETDRSRFIGRGRSPRAPRAQDWDAMPLGQGCTGSVLDPIFCIRIRLTIAPMQQETLSFTTSLLPNSATRVDAVNLAGYFSDIASAERAIEVASSEMIEELRDMSLPAENATVYQRLYDELLYTNRLLTAPDKLAIVRHGQPSLWSIGVSGDLPILLLLIDNEGGVSTISKALTAHRFLLRKGVKVDLVIFNVQPATYQMDLTDRIMSTVYTFTDAALIDRNTDGGVFVRRKDVMEPHVADTLQAFARLIVYCDARSKKNSIFSIETMNRLEDPIWNPAPPPFVPSGEVVHETGALDSKTRNLLMSEVKRVWSVDAHPPTSSSPDLDDFSLGGGDDADNRQNNSDGIVVSPGPSSKMKKGKRGITSPSFLNPASITSSAYSPLLSPAHTSPSHISSRSIKRRYSSRSMASKADKDSLEMWNGYGGVSPQGYYEIHIDHDTLPPAPWSNVIGTPNGAGTLVSETGGGFTWAWNSGRYRLTPWSNDPVVDPVGEVIYIRDDTDGKYWSPTPRPTLPAASGFKYSPRYVVQHKFGKTEFHHERLEIESVLQVGVSSNPAISAKISLLRLYNRSNRTRRLSVFGYIDWVCGDQRENTQNHIVTNQISAPHNVRCVSARRTYDEQAANNLAYFACTGQPGKDAHHEGNFTGAVRVETITCDRRQFIGRNRTLARPQALETLAWEERFGAALDPCAASHILVTIEPGQYADVLFLLGAEADSPNEQKVQKVVKDLCNVETAQEHLRVACEEWERRLNVVQVNTPHAPTNHLLNRWALYQTMSCRFWGRSAFYQSSGAFGFRDQLQDCLAIARCEPKVVREHILKCAGRQFPEGDVLHWWHEYPIHGVRTRISDDLAWLPFVVERYIATTGDVSIVIDKDGEEPNYLEMRRPLPPAHDVYDHPRIMHDTKGGVYDHCLRALKCACTEGPHGLPLIGVGDWNDGMSSVGPEGKGESVWLGWFLIATLRRFAKNVVLRIHNDQKKADELLAQAESYAVAVNKHAWDGEWYMRAFYDNGHPLGSSHTDVKEANIDSLAQTWSVISEAASPPERALQALSSVDKHLIDENIRIIKLLTPPFGSDTKATDNPGYIAGYVPGVRENGAQYTHAATWVVQAHAKLGRGDRAFYLHNMINPFSHALTQEDADRYRVEPYVVCADVYSADLHSGRGGWTWYTGSAGWMYMTGIEDILGLFIRADGLQINPCIPSKWEGYDITYRRYDDKNVLRQIYRIEVENPEKVSKGVVSIGKFGYGDKVEPIEFDRAKPKIMFEKMQGEESEEENNTGGKKEEEEEEELKLIPKVQELRYLVVLGSNEYLERETS